MIFSPYRFELRTAVRGKLHGYLQCELDEFFLFINIGGFLLRLLCFNNHKNRKGNKRFFVTFSNLKDYSIDFQWSKSSAKFKIDIKSNVHELFAYFEFSAEPTSVNVRTENSTFIEDIP